MSFPLLSWVNYLFLCSSLLTCQCSFKASFVPILPHGYWQLPPSKYHLLCNILPGLHHPHAYHSYYFPVMRTVWLAPDSILTYYQTFQWAWLCLLKHRCCSFTKTNHAWLQLNAPINGFGEHCRGMLVILWNCRDFWGCTWHCKCHAITCCDTPLTLQLYNLPILCSLPSDGLGHGR